MAYVKQVWRNYPHRSTPVSAERLTHMEDGIAAAGNNDQITVVASADEPFVAGAVDFSGSADSATANAVALQTLVDRVPSNGVLRFTGGGTVTYNKQAMLVTSKSIEIDFGTTRFRKVPVAGATSSLAGFASFTFPMGPVISVSGLNSATGQGISKLSTYATDGQFVGTVNAVSVTASSNPGWTRGDRIKIFARDEAPGGRDPGTSQVNRSGQILTFRETTSNGDGTYTIKLVGTLRDPFTTDVRLSRMPGYTVSLKGGIFESDPVLLDSKISNGGHVSITNARDARVSDMIVVSATAQILQFTNCDGYCVERPYFRFSNNDPVTTPTALLQARLGYGVLDKGSENGLIIGGFFGDLRHAYTTDIYEVDYPYSSGAQTTNYNDPVRYGRTNGFKAIGSHAEGIAGIAFNTHHGAGSVEFISCTARDCNTAFGHRGTNFRVLGGVVENCGIAFATYNDSGGRSIGFHIDGTQIDGVNQVIKVNPRFGTYGGPPGYRTYPRENEESTMKNVRAQNIHGGTVPGVIEVTNATFRMDHNEFVLAPDFINGEKLSYVVSAGVVSGSGSASDPIITTITVGSSAAFANGDHVDGVTLPNSYTTPDMFVIDAPDATHIRVWGNQSVATGMVLMRRTVTGFIAADNATLRGKNNHLDATLALNMGAVAGTPGGSPGLRFIDAGSASRADGDPTLATPRANASQKSSNIEMSGWTIDSANTAQLFSPLRSPGSSTHALLEVQSSYWWSYGQLAFETMPLNDNSALKMSSIVDNQNNATITASSATKMADGTYMRMVDQADWPIVVIESTTTGSFRSFTEPRKRGKVLYITSLSGTTTLVYSRTVTAAGSSGTSTVTGAAGAFTGADVGQLVTGSAVTAGSTITAVSTDGTTATLSAPLTGAATAVNVRGDQFMKVHGNANIAITATTTWVGVATNETPSVWRQRHAVS